MESYGSAIFRSLRKHFGNHIPETIIEPGRGMVGNAGIIEAEVVLISKKSTRPRTCAGSISTSASSMASPRPWMRRSATRSAPARPCGEGAVRARRAHLRSVDVMYEKEPYMLPFSLEIGDKVLIEGTGAYTTTYSSRDFNGMPGLRQIVI